MIRFCFLASLFLVSLSATWAQPADITGKIRVSYWDGDPAPNYGVEYHYYKTNSQLVFLDSTERSLNNYTWNSGTGRLTDSTFGEYFDYTYTGTDTGTFVFSEGGSGEFVTYDASWDLDYDGTPDGEQIDAGNLPTYSHKLILYKWLLYDQFSGGALDTTNKWTTWFAPGGVAPAIVGGKLDLEVDPASVTSEDILFAGGETLDVSGMTEPNTGLAFKSSLIIGLEVDLSLPAGVALESGVAVDALFQSGEVFAGIELANRSAIAGGIQLEYEIGDTNLGSTSANLDQTYRIRVVKIYGRLRIYINGNEVADVAEPTEFLGFLIFAFNDASQAMTATVDNVRVLVDPNLTEPSVLTDTDGDGLSNYDETNLYSTDPNNNDKYGDGLKDGELVLAGANPNVDYSSVLTLINSKLEDARAGSTMIDVSNSNALLRLQIERSNDLSVWSQDTEDLVTVEIPLSGEKGFFRFAIPQ